MRDAGEVWRVGLEDEFIHADGDWADEEGLKFLVVFGAGRREEGGGGRVSLRAVYRV